MFDLNLLLARADAQGLRLTASQRAWIPDAIGHAMHISFAEYRSRVVSYLDPQQLELYQEKSAWDSMQAEVVSRLEALE